MIQRIFHPIGQGAFYSERHDGFNIVYDCGTEYKNRSNPFYDKVVRQSFRETDVIDILFISHFDYDHVSKIEVLRNHVKEIRFVVLPLLHNNEKILISNIYRSLDLDLSQLVNDPEGFFGKECKVIHVKPSDEKGSESNDSQIEIENIPQDKDGKYRIDSQKKLTIGGLTDWVYIPYNHEYSARNTELLKLLKLEKIDIAKLQTDAKYTLDKITKDLRISKPRGGKKFQQVYDKLNGKINQNSMLVYSGPFYLQSNPNIESYYYGHSQLSPMVFHYLFDDNRVACVFTGDADLNISPIQTIYAGLWQYVGTIQIPHHGDLKSFNSFEISDKRGYICPISYGNSNTYGHPSSLVIAEILSKHSLPIFVTEVSSTVFIQRIEHRL